MEILTVCSETIIHKILLKQNALNKPGIDIYTEQMHSLATARLTSIWM